ncbi:hypothetical protein ARMGADRAFT_1017312 [Armillaria gallica]|uniref:Uncharacterized protein n=1 Tax=Armillaria gallica TaxID=47427 RepID=A0A2H3CUC4_ARMGA|nr:hypothetical protein ARMGADRAFT_1017312 [Armillaria gallica]
MRSTKTQAVFPDFCVSFWPTAFETLADISQLPFFDWHLLKLDGPFVPMTEEDQRPVTRHTKSLLEALEQESTEHQASVLFKDPHRNDSVQRHVVDVESGAPFRQVSTEEP